MSLRAEGVAIPVGYRLLRHVVPRNDEIKIPLNPPLEKGVQRPRKGDLTFEGLFRRHSGFCSCLIHQAQLPNKLGNYIFKRPYLGYFITGEN